MESYFGEEFVDVSESEHRVQLEFLRFGDQRATSFRPTPCVLASCATANERISATVGTVEVQRAAAQQLVALHHHGEIADGLRHFELRARQHDALSPRSR